MSHDRHESCIGGNQSAINNSDRRGSCCGYFAHTWQAQNSSSSSCLQSYECDCDDLHLTKNDQEESSIKVNASLRASAQYRFSEDNTYEYEIIDIQASPDSGHIVHPPDPCLKHNEQNLSSRMPSASRQTSHLSSSVHRKSGLTASTTYEEIQNTKLFDNVAGVTNGSNTKADTEQHTRKLSQFFEDQYCQRSFTDFAVFVECTRFDVHKAVLACHSGYFANIFMQKNRESCASNCSVKLDNGFGITPNTFRAILDFMYSGTIQPGSCNAGKLLSASRVLQIPELQDICERLINMLPVHVNKCSSEDLQKHWKRIARHFGEIWKTDQFLLLTGECLKLLLSREDLTCSRLLHARALLRWLNYDRCSRSAWVECLTEYLRLSPQEFGAITTSEEFLIASCEVQEALRKQVVCTE